MAKIAVSSQGRNLESKVDPRFGRAAFFLVVDSDTNEFIVLDNNQARDMSQGAGIQAAELVARSGAKTIVSGMIGPKAWDALNAAGLEIVQEASGTVSEAVQGYLDGRYKAGGDPMGGGGLR